MNLDQLCVRYSIELANTKLEPKKVETVVRNAIGILREDGIYALYLYLDKKITKEDNKKDNKQKNLEYREVKNSIDNLWKNESLDIIPRKPVNNTQVEEIVKDPYKTLLTRKLTERMLIYALYGLRNRESPKDKKQKEEDRKENQP